MCTKHPEIIINFVPAHMTGQFQPADVRLQCLFKHSMKQTAYKDVVQEVMEKLRNGALPYEVSVESKLGVLHDRTVHWIWCASTELNKPLIIKKVRLPHFYTQFSDLDSSFCRHGRCVA